MLLVLGLTLKFAERDVAPPKSLIYCAMYASVARPATARHCPHSTIRTIPTISCGWRRLVPLPVVFEDLRGAYLWFSNFREDEMYKKTRVGSTSDNTSAAGFGAR
eukprot:113624-Prymnesium_polylepis.1